MVRMTLATATLIAVSAVAHAQTPNPDPAQQPAQSFEDVQALLLSGDTVHVFDDKGTGTKGRLSSIRDGVLNLTFDSTRRTVPFDTIVQIDRTRRDPVKDGVLKGLAAGAVVGYVLGRRADSPACSRRDIECGQAAIIGAYGGAFWGSIFGWIVDATHRTRETIFAR